MRRALYLGLASTVLLAYLFFRSDVLSSFSGTEDSFPKLDIGATYFGEVKPIPGIGFPGGGLLLEMLEGSNDLMFIALIADNISPEFYQLTYKKAPWDADKDSNNILNSPQNLFGFYNCLLTGSLALSGALNGVLKCKDNTSTEFSLRRGQSDYMSVVSNVDTASSNSNNTSGDGVIAKNLLSRQDISPGASEEAMTLLSHLRNTDLSSASLAKERERLASFESSANEARKMYSSSSRIKEEVSIREGEVEALIQKRQKLIAQLSELEKTRQQLIRASGRGIEVQLARRLTNLESAHFQKFLSSPGDVRIALGEQETDSSYLEADNNPYVVQDNDPSMVGAVASDAELDSNKSAPSPASTGKVEWWKQIE